MKLCAVQGKGWKYKSSCKSKINQTPRKILHVFSHMWNLDLKKDMEVEGEYLDRGRGPAGGCDKSIMVCVCE
jgi:hypothetical protein